MKHLSSKMTDKRTRSKTYIYKRRYRCMSSIGRMTEDRSTNEDDRGSDFII